MRKEVYKRFALIELLIVIAMIAILASMLLPALSKARADDDGVWHNSMSFLHYAVWREDSSR